MSTVAGAVLRAFRKGLRGAWSPLGAGSVHSGRRSIQSFHKRVAALEKGVAARLVAAGRRQWQAQYSEPPERPLGAGSVHSGRRSTKVTKRGCGAPGRCWAPAVSIVAGAILGVAARLVAAGRRQCPQWQAQYSEPSERGCGCCV